MERRPVLLVSYEMSHFRELARVARLLQHHPRYRPVLMLNHPQAANPRDFAAFEREGIDWFVFEPEPVERQASGWRLAVQALLFAPVYLWSLLKGCLRGCRQLAGPLRRSLYVFMRKARKRIRLSQRSPRLSAVCHRVGRKLRGGLRHVRRRWLRPLVARARRARAFVRTLPTRCRRGLMELGCNWLRRLPPALRSWCGVVQLCRTLKERQQQYGRMLQRRQPCLVVMTEANVSHATELLTRAASLQSVPVVIIPFTVANVREFVQGFQHVAEHHISFGINRLAGWLHPRWSHEGAHTLLRLPGPEVLAQEWLGLAPREPWTPNAGSWNALAAESAHMLACYERDGLPGERLFLTGALSDDVLARQHEEAELHRETLYRALGLSAGRPMLLCALPPDQGVKNRPDCEFDSYQALLEFWLSALARVTSHQVIVSLHPRSAPYVADIVKRHGLPIAPVETITLVPLCDLYLASVSATIRWAIACGIPVLNYDVYQYRYDDYEQAGGVLTVERKQDFLTILERLTDEPRYREEVRQRQRACMDQWGQLDGQSGERLLQLFDRLSARAQSRVGLPLLGAGGWFRKERSRQADEVVLHD